MHHHRFVILDFYRFLFAVAVAIDHFQGFGAAQKAYLAVDFFFVLSGFVLCSAYAARSGRPEFFQSFMVDRIARLYPLHLAVLLVTLGLNVAFYILSKGQLLENDWFYRDGRIYTFVLNLILAQGIGLTTAPSWNAPSWSISVELYVNIFLALALVKLPRVGRMAAVASIALIAVVAYALLFNRLGSLEHMGENIGGFLNAGLLRGFAGIALGMLCYIAFEAAPKSLTGDRAVRSLAAATIFLAILTFALIAFGAGIHNLDFALIPIIFFLILATALYEAASPMKPPLRSLFEKCGALSYAIYMIHWPILVFAGYFLAYLWRVPVVAAAPSTTAIYLAVILLIAWLAHHRFELPMKRRVRAALAPVPADARR
ncbi:MAG TPA: acyltransferase [Aliidongia sp.]|nr:acyltransferase [Aliidongia sp.]